MSRKRSRGVHAWVFSNEVKGTEGGPEPGDTVRVYDRGEFAGSGVFNPHSLIAVRLYSRQDEELDLAFIKARLEEAHAYRVAHLPGESDFRLVFGESDRLPGLVVDKYAQHFVVQTYSLGLERRLGMVVEALVDRFEVGSVYEKNDFRLRDPEGLDRREGPLHGRVDDRVVIAENGAKFLVDIRLGQKSGYYYDQRQTRKKVREMVADRRFLDVYCYTGGFAVNAALGGAQRVVAVDSSAPACSIGMANAELNGVENRCEFLVADAFRYLRQLRADQAEFDAICLDPPSYIKSRKERASGMKAFRTANALAMRALPPGGILISCSCSHHLFWQDMVDMLSAAAQESGRSFIIVDRTTQGPDHPVLLSMPESEYLRCLFLKVV